MGITPGYIVSPDYFNGSSYTFTWTGRELTGASRGTDSYTFAYNESGLHISKIKNGVESKYCYDGDLLLMEIAKGDKNEKNTLA